MKKFAAALVGLVLLSACSSGGGTSNAPMMTGGQQRMNTYKATLAGAGTAGKACTENLLSDRDNAAAAAIFPLHASSSLTVAQLASTAQPTTEDVRRIIAFKQGYDKCVDESLASVRNMDLALYLVIQRNLRENDVIIADMARNQLNIGDANRRMQAEDGVNRRDFEAVLAQSRDVFYRQHVAELQQRQAGQMQQAADMQALNQSLQQFNNQLQQQTQHQQMLNAINRPRMATCNGFGYGVSCTSY